MSDLLRLRRSAVEKGFTLVELVTCLVIIGVLAAVAGPRFLDYRPFQQHGYVDELAAAIRYSQRAAIASACPVLFTGDSTGYQAMQQTVCAPPSGVWTLAVMREDGTPLSGSPPAGVTLSPSAQVIFTASGSVSGGAAPPALSVGPFTLTVDAGSGLVQVVP